MTSTTFYIPSINMMGSGCLADAIASLKGRDFSRALIVTDKGLSKIGMAEKIKSQLASIGLQAFIFDGAQPNPTTKNVEDGLAVLKQNNCNLVVSLGGGSPHDCAKGIALCATNGGNIKDYEGLNKSKKPQMPLVAINTTAGTASEMTRFCIITDESRHIKMAIVDPHVTPILSVNDPTLMIGMPKDLTAATGMDALTHAVEAYVSTAASPITDTCALKAISLISTHLRRAVANGSDMEAREQMAYAQFLAGMAFNNASLGYVHAMAHQLGGFYDLPHGMCNAILLPHVESFNAAVAADRLRDVAIHMNCIVEGRTDAEAAELAIGAIRMLSVDVGVPTGLKAIGLKEEDIPTLAANALRDACGLTNPRKATQADIENIFLWAA